MNYSFVEMNYLVLSFFVEGFIYLFWVLWKRFVLLLKRKYEVEIDDSMKFIFVIRNLISAFIQHNNDNKRKTDTRRIQNWL